MRVLAVALLGEYDPAFTPHVATADALRHACEATAIQVRGDWVSTANADPSIFGTYAGVWILPGSPYKSLDRTLEVIRHARQHAIPCFGTCGGFQHMILEYARNVLHFPDAQHAEYDPYASRLFVSRLECSLLGREMSVRLAAGSRVAEIYGTRMAREQYYCNFGVNPDAVPLLRAGPLKITGSDDEGEVRVVELPSHPFFIGTLFVPQLKSRAGRPHPLVAAFVRALARRECKR